MKRFTKIILFLMYIFIITTVFLEIVVRLSGYSRARIYDPIYRPAESIKDIPYIHKANLKNALGPGLSIVNTDSLGLRSQIAGIGYGPKKENEYRIAVIGDSNTFGMGVKNAKDTFDQVLENALNQKQDSAKVKVFNYDVVAYSVKEMIATFQHRALDIKPDLVFMAIVPEDFDLSRTLSVDKWGYLTTERASKFIGKDSVLKYLLRKLHSVYFLQAIS